MGPISKRDRGIMKESETYFDNVAMTTFKNTVLLGDRGSGIIAYTMGQ